MVQKKICTLQPFKRMRQSYMNGPKKMSMIIKWQKQKQVVEQFLYVFIFEKYKIGTHEHMHISTVHIIYLNIRGYMLALWGK